MQIIPVSQGYAQVCPGALTQVSAPRELATVSVPGANMCQRQPNDPGLRERHRPTGQAEFKGPSTVVSDQTAGIAETRDDHAVDLIDGDVFEPVRPVGVSGRFASGRRRHSRRRGAPPGAELRGLPADGDLPDGARQRQSCGAHRVTRDLRQESETGAGPGCGPGPNQKSQRSGAFSAGG